MGYGGEGSTCLPLSKNTLILIGWKRKETVTINNKKAGTGNGSGSEIKKKKQQQQKKKVRGTASQFHSV